MTTRTAALLAALTLLLPAAAQAADGEALYTKQCAKCHGSNGRSDTPVGKMMKVPVVAGREWSPDAVTAALREKAKHKSVNGKVSDADLLAILEYLDTLPGDS